MQERRKYMKKVCFFLLSISLVLVSCSKTSPASPAATLTATLLSTVSSTEMPLYTPTPTWDIFHTSTPSVTPSPTIVPSPSPTITPIINAEINAHPLVLNEKNIASKMKLLARYGTGEVYDVEWSPDGKYLAVATGLGVFLYDALSLERVRLIEINGRTESVAFNPSGTELAILHKNKISLWFVESGQKKNELEGELERGYWTIKFKQNGYLAAFGSVWRGDPYSVLHVWQINSNQLLFTDELSFGRGVAVDINSAGDEILYLAGGKLSLYDINTKRVIHLSDDSSDAVFSQDESKVFSIQYSQDNPSALWTIDKNSGETLNILEEADCEHIMLGNDVGICYDEVNMIVFDSNNGTELERFISPYETGNVSISSDSKRLAIIESEWKSDFVHVVDVQSHKEIKSIEFDAFDEFATGILSFDNIDYYAAATTFWDKDVIKIWNLSNGETITTIQVGENVIRELALSPDRHTIASSESGAVRLWDVESGKNTITFDMPTEENILEFSFDGQNLAIFETYSGVLYDADLITGVLKRQNDGYSSYSYRIAPISYSKEKNLFVWKDIYPEKGILSVMNLTSQKTTELSYTVEPVPEWRENMFLEAFAISSDEKYAVVGAWYGSIYVWDFSTQKFLREMRGHKTNTGGGETFEHLKFSPHSNILLSVGWDDTTRLWNIHTGNQIRVLNVCCFADFTPDGRFLLTAGDGVLRVWGIPPLP